MTITLEQYFRGRPHTQTQELAAIDLLQKVNALINEFRQSGGEVPINPHTGSMISGLTEGGFRLPDCVQGSKYSSHKILFPENKAGLDVYDPDGKLDAWITRKILEKHDLYREHPDKTVGWCHLSNRKPPSGCRTFLP